MRYSRSTRALLSKYIQPAIASDCLLLVSVRRQGCQYCSRTEPSKSDAQLVTAVIQVAESHALCPVGIRKQLSSERCTYLEKIHSLS